MIPNNTKSGIISIIRFSGEKKHSTFSAASSDEVLSVNAVGTECGPGGETAGRTPSIPALWPMVLLLLRSFDSFARIREDNGLPQLFHGFIGPFSILTSRDMDNLASGQNQKDVVCCLAIRIRDVGNRDIRNHPQGYPLIHVSENSFFLIEQDTAFGLIGTCRIDKDLVVRFPGERSEFSFIGLARIRCGLLYTFIQGLRWIEPQ